MRRRDPSASQARDTAAPPPRRRRRGAAARASLGLAGCLLAGVGLLAWLGSASGLGWLLRQPWVASRAALQVQDLRGSLWSELRVGDLRWQGGSVSLHASALRLRWRIDASLRHAPTLHVLTLRARQLDVRSLSPSGGTSPPLRPPASLRPPLELRIDELRIERLRVGAQGAAQWRELGAWQARLRGDATQWQGTLQARGPWGELQAQTELGAQAPFALRGRLDASLQPTAQARPGVAAADLHASVDGTLERPRLLATATLASARALLDAALRPFESSWLGASRIEADDVDPHAFDSALPQARLQLRAQLRGAAASALDGSLTLRNGAPGDLDAQRLPLQAAQARLQLRDGVLRADALELALSGGARLDGTLAWPLRGAIRLQLQAHRLDLHALASRLVATRLDGPLRLQADAASQSVQASLRQPGWQVELQAQRQGTRIELAQGLLRADGASLDLRGRVDLAAQQAFELHAAMHDFDPQRFGPWPAARLNLQGQAQGQLRPRRARFALQLQPSQWRGQRLQGQASAELDGAAIRALQADLRLGSNQLRASGNFGRPGDALQLALHAPRLAQFGADWAGSAQADATLRGSLTQPAGRLSMQAQGLRVPGVLRIAELSADAELQRGLDGRLQLHARARDVEAGSLRLRDASADADGTLRAHRLQLHVDDAQRLRLELRAHGGWQPGVGWSGSIDALSNAGRYAFATRQPAQLRLGLDGGVTLQHVALHSAGGDLRLDSLRRVTGADAHWSSQGAASDVDPLYWARLAGVDVQGLQSTLRLRAAWELRTGVAPHARVSVERSAGDVELPTEPPLRLGLSALRLQADLRTPSGAAGEASAAASGHALLQARVQAAGSRLGDVQASAELPLAIEGQGVRLLDDAPLQGAAQLRLPDIAWVSALLPPGIELGGKLAGQLRLGGVASAPSLGGALQGHGLALAWPRVGVDLRGGELDAAFQGNQVQLRSLLAHDARGTGSLRASGAFALADGRPDGSLHVVLDKLHAIDRPLQRVRLSGDAQLRASNDGLGVDARLRVDDADIELGGDNAPQLADDVVIEGRKPPAPGNAMPLHARVQLDLGDAFHVSGYGVDARLGGALTLDSDPGQPLRASGSVAVRSGSYSAYGQQLRLVSGGTVNFSGPVDNPGLNLSATRDNLPVQVGVRIVGTLRMPQLVLSSTPPMTDSQILSWLVLGQDPSTLGTDQSALLQAAAGAMLAGGHGPSLTGRIASALGLDELKLNAGDGGLDSSVVTLGKQLRSRLSVSVERGLAATGSLFNVRWRFTDRLSLRLQSGTDNAVDVFYNFRFH